MAGHISKKRWEIAGRLRRGYLQTALDADKRDVFEALRVDALQSGGHILGLSRKQRIKDIVDLEKYHTHMALPCQSYALHSPCTHALHSPLTSAKQRRARALNTHALLSYSSETHRIYNTLYVSVPRIASSTLYM
eukprot:1425321-Rhodomonas_salina.2